MQLPAKWQQSIMRQETSWVVDITKKFESFNADQFRSRSIYRVPSNLKLSKTECYTPQIVSFGPYHHGDEQLKPMEEHKERALFHFLKRTSIPLQTFVNKMEQVETELRDSYAKPVVSDPSSFLKMMVVDGCFMLEILRMVEKVPEGYPENDPIFSQHGKLYALPYITRDMLMLENQIPLLVLDRLVAVEKNKPESDVGYLNKLVVDFILNPRSSPNQSPATTGVEVDSLNKRTDVKLGLHVLDVFRKNMIGKVGSSENEPRASNWKANLPCNRKNKLRVNKPPTRNRNLKANRSVVELRKAGISFKKSEENSLLYIDFNNGVLTLPLFTIDDTTESMLLNMMAFEHLHHGTGNEVSAYAAFMDKLIDSANDVKILQLKGIIENGLGSDNAVAELFNGLCRDVIFDPNSDLAVVFKEVENYSTKKIHVWLADLIHTYFSNPWVFISLVAAIVLLALTMVQTVYGVRSYYSQVSTEHQQ